MDSNNVLDQLTFPEESPVKTMLLQQEHYEILRIALGKGLIIPPHEGGHAAFFLVLQGRGIFTRGDEKTELGQNQYLHIEADDIRGIEALEDLVILAVKE